MSAWLSTGAAADHLGVSERTVRRWCRDGSIPLSARWQPAGFRGSWLIAREWIATTPVAEMADMAVLSTETSDAEG